MKMVWKSKVKQTALKLTDKQGWENIPDACLKADIKYSRSRLCKPMHEKGEFQRLFLDEDLK